MRIVLKKHNLLLTNMLLDKKTFHWGLGIEYSTYTVIEKDIIFQIIVGPI